MERIVVLIIITLTKASSAFGENPCNTMYPQNSGQWGVGFVWFSESVKVSIYDQPGGEKIGTIIRDKYGKVTFEGLKSNSILQINANDFVWAGHTLITLLKVYRTQSNNFCNILNQTTNSGFWIAQKELEESKMKFLTYRELLTAQEKIPDELSALIKGANIGVNLSKSCLNLRVKNNVNSEMISCLSSNDWGQAGTHTHLKILEVKEDWMKVEAKVYLYDETNDESGEGCSFKVAQKYIGWLKATNENGFPNIWYSVTTY